MHGSPWTCDTHVPLMCLDRRWISPGRRGEDAEPVDIAPAPARLLETGPPGGCEGRVLTEILKR